MIIEVTFWLLAAILVYVYAGYPLILMLLGQLVASRQDNSSDMVAEDLPSVTMLISAFNEADCIADKIENTLALDYPRDKLKVIVISDASDDSTDEIVLSYKDRNVQLLRMEDRGGKTLGLNAGVEAASGELVVFSDANAMYRSDAITRLASSFQEASVGAAIGESTYNESASESGKSESLYWRYETWIKRLETRLGSTVGGDGAIYAVRRDLYEPMRADALSDFVNPLQVVRSGHDCVYQPLAISYEEAAENYAQEYRRKVRIVNRAWRALGMMREMLNPFRQGLFAFKLLSHKVLRWLVGPMMVAVFLLNIAIVDQDMIYFLSFLLQILFYGFAAAGFVMREREHQPTLFRIPYFFCLVNIAAFVGMLEALFGKSYTTWATVRTGG